MLSSDFKGMSDEVIGLKIIDYYCKVTKIDYKDFISYLKTSNRLYVQVSGLGLGIRFAGLDFSVIKEAIIRNGASFLGKYPSSVGVIRDMIISDIDNFSFNKFNSWEFMQEVILKSGKDVIQYSAESVDIFARSLSMFDRYRKPIAIVVSLAVIGYFVRSVNGLRGK